jgi:hypothetical protein
MLEATGAVVTERDNWMPRGWTNPTEARLETFGPAALPGTVDWRQLSRWWLKHPGGANTPNWDFAASCQLGSRRGLVLIEAKAHTFEMGMSGKTLRKTASVKSRENHSRICAAIAEASRGMGASVPDVSFSASRGYQLANRLAHVWWLADRGIPTVLLYLAFLNDERMQDVGDPIRDPDDWRKWFAIHSHGALPEDAKERWITCGSGSFFLGLRTRDMPKGYRSAATEPRDV